MSNSSAISVPLNGRARRADSFRVSSTGLYPAARNAGKPVRKLALGILLQAFRDLVPKNLKTKPLDKWQEDALEWFYSNELSPGSFRWVCQILDLDLSGVRRWIRIYEDSDQQRRREIARQLSHFQTPARVDSC